MNISDFRNRLDLRQGPHPWLVVILLLAALTPYFVGLGDSSLWDSNEAFYAETPRQMTESGDYVIPLFNYFFRWHKPPLTYWGVAASYQLFGVSEWAERFPIALAAAAWILLGYWLGRRWFGGATGLIAALVLATNFRVLIMARRAITEIWLALFISVALVCLGLALVENRKNATYLAALAYTALGLGIMTKGPVAAVLTAAVVLVYLVWTRNLSASLRVKPILGLGLVAILVLPWYIRVIDVVGWQPILNFVMSDNLGRFLSEEFGPQRGVAFYLGVLTGDFFPWSLVCLTMVAIAVLKAPGMMASLRRVVQALHSGSQATGSSGSRAIGWLIIWFCVVIIFFSLSRNKQEYYILPAYLPASLLVSLGLSSLDGLPGRLRRALKWSFVWIGCAVALLGLGVLLLSHNVFPELPSWQSIASGVPLLACGAGVIFVAGKRKWLWCSGLVLAAAWSAIGAIVLYFLPQWEDFKPVHQFARRIVLERQPGDYAGYYKYSAPSLAFYLKEPIFEIIWEDEIIHLLSTSRRRLFCIISEEQFRGIEGRLRQPYRVVMRRPMVSLRARDIFRTVDLSDRPQLLLISNSP